MKRSKNIPTLDTLSRVVYSKKYLLVLSVVLLLIACGKENIDVPEGKKNLLPEKAVTNTITKNTS